MRYAIRVSPHLPASLFLGKKPIVPSSHCRLMTTISALLALLKSDKVVWL